MFKTLRSAVLELSHADEWADRRGEANKNNFAYFHFEHARNCKISKCTAIHTCCDFVLYNRHVAGRPRGRSSSPARVKLLASPCCPDRLWCPSGLLANGHRGYSGRGLVRSRKRGSIQPVLQKSSWHSA
jgi:hypothetical protein